MVEQRGESAEARLVVVRLSWSNLLQKAGYGLLGLATILFAVTAMGMMGGMSGAVAGSLVKVFLTLAGCGLLLIVGAGLMRSERLRRRAPGSDGAPADIDWRWVQHWEELMSRPVH